MTLPQEGTMPRDLAAANEAPISAVSWAAIFAGAVVAAAASLLLLSLGAGLGFASLSPWRNEGPSAVTFTVMSAIWLILVQWIASGLGGYLTGMLRTKWVGLRTHEVFFRDTAHGFTTWAVATIITAMIVAAAASAAAGGAAKVASSVASGAGQAVSAGMSASGYEIDSLFRSTSPNAAGAEVREEALRILMKGLREGNLEAADRAYLADLIAARTGISSKEALQRVDSAIAQMKAAETEARKVADTARKSASAASIVTALSMLIGAFIASVAAALGGAQRDD